MLVEITPEEAVYLAALIDAECAHDEESRLLGADARPFSLESLASRLEEATTK